MQASQCNRGALMQRPGSHAPLKAAKLGKQQYTTKQRSTSIVCANRDGGFASGFLVGGIIGGTLGFLFAPQISRAILGEDQRVKLPRFDDEVVTSRKEADPELSPQAIKGELTDKINLMNSKIDELSSRLTEVSLDSMDIQDQSKLA